MRCPLCDGTGSVWIARNTLPDYRKPCPFGCRIPPRRTARSLSLLRRQQLAYRVLGLRLYKGL